MLSKRMMMGTAGFNAPLIGDIGIFTTGYAASTNNTMDYVTITSTGNATDFGDLSTTRISTCNSASSTRGIIGSGTGYVNIIDYITINTKGNSTDFGDLVVFGHESGGGCSSATRGIICGGEKEDNVYTNVIEYVTIATTGNSTDFGDMTVARRNRGCASPTRGVFGGGYNGAGYSNVIDYFTIASAGNATNFGDLTEAADEGHRGSLDACASETRGLFSGGNAGPTNIIEYVTIASAGNATNFGDLTVSRYGLASLSNATRGLHGSGYTITNVNIIDYNTIASASNATDFGDISLARRSMSALSNAHGGL